MPHIHPLIARVINKLRILLIDSIIGQMNVLFPEVAFVWSDVLLSRKASQAFLVDVDPHRTDAAE